MKALVGALVELGSDVVLTDGSDANRFDIT